MTGNGSSRRLTCACKYLILGSGQEVPWHSHTAVTDTFTCLGGLMVVKTLDVVVGHEL
jgi:hypothetical protein